MDTPYTTEARTEAERNFTASYAADLNALVTDYLLKWTGDKAEKLYSETAIGRAIIDKKVKYTLGRGLVPEASPETSTLGWSAETASRFKREAESFFRLVTNSPSFDWYGKSNFLSLQRTALRSIYIRGDVLLRRGFSRRSPHLPFIQVIGGQWVGEGASFSTKKKALGVEFDERGREMAYFIKETNESRIETGASRRVSKYQERTGFEEYRLVKLAPRESNQIRGIPILNSVSGDIMDVQVFTRSTVAHAIVQAFFAVFFENSDNADASKVGAAVEALKRTMSAVAQGQERPIGNDAPTGSGTGIMMELPRGQTAHVVESTMQGQQYDIFVKSLLELIGAAVGVPLELMTEAFDSSFSAARGTIAAAQKGFEIDASEFADEFCRPVWEMVTDYGIRTHHITAPHYEEMGALERRAVLAATWIGPTAVTIDPVKEYQAMQTAINARLITRERAIRQTSGEDFDETVTRLGEEEEALRRAGLISDNDSAPYEGEEE